MKKTVNQDDPTVYHLFYADEGGSAGSDITFFEYPGARKGVAGAGMVYRVVWRVASAEALDFWQERLGGAGVTAERGDTTLLFRDPEGLELELAVVETGRRAARRRPSGDPGRARAPGLRLGSRLHSDPGASRSFLEEAMDFRAIVGDRVRVPRRAARLALRLRPDRHLGFGGAGTIHHVAWASPMDEHEAWRERVLAAGARPTPVIDRFYFRSIYFREPSGVLFEIATIGPGFATDEPVEHLGERLSLPPAFEHLREQVEPLLTPLPALR